MLLENILFRRLSEQMRLSFLKIPGFDSFDTDTPNQSVHADFINLFPSEFIYPFSAPLVVSNERSREALQKRLGDNYEFKRHRMLGPDLKAFLVESGFTLNSPVSNQDIFLQSAFFSSAGGLRAQVSFRRLFDAEGLPEGGCDEVKVSFDVKIDFDDIWQNNSFPSDIFQSEDASEIEKFISRYDGDISAPSLCTDMNLLRLIQNGMFAMRARACVSARIDFDRHVSEGHNLSLDDCLDAFERRLTPPIFEARRAYQRADGLKSYNIVCAGFESAEPSVINIPIVVKGQKFEIITAYNISDNLNRLLFLFSAGHLSKASFTNYPEHLRVLRQKHGEALAL